MIQNYRITIMLEWLVPLLGKMTCGIQKRSKLIIVHREGLKTENILKTTTKCENHDQSHILVV